MIPYFTPVQGAGQGDGPSPALWLGFSDIVLTAMDHLDADDFFLSSTFPTSATAFADDISSAKNSFKALQEEADLMSAFAWTGLLMFSEKKLRAFSINHMGIQQSIVIHTPKGMFNTPSFTGHWQLHTPRSMPSHRQLSQRITTTKYQLYIVQHAQDQTSLLTLLQ